MTSGSKTSRKWKHVLLLDDGHDDDSVDVSTVLRTSRGGGRTQARRNGEYRRSNRHTEDGYGDSDFS